MAIISKATRTYYETIFAARRNVETCELDDADFQRFINTRWGKFAAHAHRRNIDIAQGWMVFSLLATFGVLPWIVGVFFNYGHDLWGYITGTFIFANAFFWAMPILGYSIYYPTMLAARSDYEDAAAAPARELARRKGVEQTAILRFVESLRRDIEAAGYQIVSADDSSHTYVTARGVITLMFDENDDMFLALNGSPIRDGYSSLLETYDNLGEIGTTSIGDTVNLSTPTVWTGEQRTPSS